MCQLFGGRSTLVRHIGEGTDDNEILLDKGDD